MPQHTSAKERALELLLRHAEAREEESRTARLSASGKAAPPPAVTPRNPTPSPRQQDTGSSPPQSFPASRRVVSPQQYWQRLNPEEKEAREKQKPSSAEHVLNNVLQYMGSSPEQLRLSLLWRHWEMVMGAELAPLVRPLGHHNDILLVGVEDAMLMQEIHLQSGELLERVNAFMEKPFFTSVKVSLILDKTQLDGPLRCAVHEEEKKAPLPHSEARGIYLSSMDAQSPVARAYARFVSRKK